MSIELRPVLSGEVRSFANGTLAKVNLVQLAVYGIAYISSLIKAAARLDALTGPEKKRLVDDAIIAAYRKAKPFISVGWLAPVWWFVDPYVEAAIPQITEAIYQALKPHLEAQ